MAGKNVQSRTMLKIWLRVLPLLALAFLSSWLEKINIGFAALEMNSDLGFSNSVFGLGAGFFAIGYTLFSVPGTLLMKRVGVRRWIALTLIACGLVSAGMALITRAQDLYILRTLLGMTEATIGPGIIIFLGYWFPIEFRARAWSVLTLVSPLALVVVGPVSSMILEVDGVLGMAGWQWLFIIEAMPALLVALAIFLLLANKPSEARWLSADEKAWLEDKLASEQNAVVGQAGDRPDSARLAFVSGRVWALAAVNCGLGMIAAGILYFLPLMVRTMGFSTGDVGLIVVPLAIVGALTLPLWGYWTDRTSKREIVLVTGCCVSATGLLFAGVLMPSPWALVGLAMAMMGFYGGAPASAMLPYTFLKGSALAAGVALVGAAASIGTFIASYIVGRLMDFTGSYVAALMFLGSVAVAATIIIGAQLIWDGRRSRAILLQPVAAS